MYLRMKVSQEVMHTIDTMMANGCLYREVMAATGLSHGTVTRAHRKQGQYLVGPRPSTKMKIKSAHHPHRLSIPFEVIPKIDMLVEQGHTYGTISKALRCSINTIERAHSRRGGYSDAPARVTQ